MNARTGDHPASRPPRIATVIPSLLPFGGVERVILTHATQYRMRGIEVDLVFVNEAQDVTSSVPAGCRTFNLGAARLRQAIRPLVSYLRAERPDAIHATMWPLTSCAVIARGLAGSTARLVLSDHNPLSIQYAPRGRMHRAILRASMALTYPFADARVAVSGGVADDVAKLSGLPRERFTVIHNPIALPLDLPPADAAENAWRGWKGKRIITVGRLKTQKNHPLLLRAFKRLLEHTDARLMLLGVGELFDETAAYAASLGLAEKVLMPGQVNDPVPYYRSADLFVLSSDYEGFGNVIVEALACGVPVVSTDCPGGPAEILAGGTFGRLVPVGDEAALGSAMLAALSGQPDIKRLQARAGDFAPPVVAGQYLNLLLPGLTALTALPVGDT